MYKASAGATLPTSIIGSLPRPGKKRTRSALRHAQQIKTRSGWTT